MITLVKLCTDVNELSWKWQERRSIYFGKESQRGEEGINTPPPEQETTIRAFALSTLLVRAGPVKSSY